MNEAAAIVIFFLLIAIFIFTYIQRDMSTLEETYTHNEIKRDWVAEYMEIKNTAIMKKISICKMQDGGYKIVNKGRPIGSIGNLYKGKLSKESCCSICVKHYYRRLADSQSNTIVETI